MKKISTILFLILVFAFGTMKAQDIENLYVSVTGWAQWDELENADGYMAHPLRISSVLEGPLVRYT